MAIVDMDLRGLSSEDLLWFLNAVIEINLEKYGYSITIEDIDEEIIEVVEYERSRER
jgi:N-acetyl-anhydromuramyl-L-alanine amidase AmpD